MAHPVVSCLCQLMSFLGFGTVCCPSAPHVCSYSLASMLPDWDWLLLSGLCWLSARCPGNQWRPSCMFLAQDAGLHNTLVFSRFWTFGVSVLMWFSSPTLCSDVWTLMALLGAWVSSQHKRPHCLSLFIAYYCLSVLFLGFSVVHFALFEGNFDITDSILGKVKFTCLQRRERT